MNPNSRLGTSPHRGGWVMDAETQAERFIGIVNPRQERKFAGAIGRLAKTDAI
jgi:hypothetical protein